MSKQWSTKLIKETILDVLSKSDELMHIYSIHAKMPSLEFIRLKSALQQMTSHDKTIVYISNRSTINGYKLNEDMNFNKLIHTFWRRPKHELYNTQECRAIKDERQC